MQRPVGAAGQEPLGPQHPPTVSVAQAVSVLRTTSPEALWSTAAAVEALGRPVLAQVGREAEVLGPQQEQEHQEPRTRVEAEADHTLQRKQVAVAAQAS